MQTWKTMNGIQEVGGSTPPGSTTQSIDFIAFLRLYFPLGLSVCRLGKHQGSTSNLCA
jgi:hypothetical protein